MKTGVIEIGHEEEGYLAVHLKAQNGNCFCIVIDVEGKIGSEKLKDQVRLYGVRESDGEPQDEPFKVIHLP